MSLSVLVLATTYPRWDDDEVPSFVADLSSELATQGLDVVVLAPHDPDAARREVRSGVTVYRFPYFLPLEYQRVAYGGGILPSVTKSVLSTLQLPFFLLSLLVHTAWLIRREDVDVINSHWAVPCGVVGAMASALTGVGHVMTLHAGGVLGLHRAPFRRQTARFLYEHSDHITPVSTHIEGKFVELLPASITVDDSRFTVQPMGAHVSDFSAVDGEEARTRLGVPVDTVCGLFVGRLAEKKGVDQLLLAVERLSDTSTPFGLTIVGTGKLEAELRQEARDRDLSDVVTFEGWVSDDELKAWYAAADFVVVPSVETDCGDTEGMPTVISEAFAAGTPVLATDVGGIPDVVEDGYSGLIVPQRRPDRLADAMAQLIDDESMRQRLATNAAAQAATLDWSECADTYLGLLHGEADGTSSSRPKEAV
jgi:glycosyltransferase involved in cell wall biosynthesis